MTGYTPMARANYTISTKLELATKIDSYCTEYDISEAEFFRQAARRQLQLEETE